MILPSGGKADLSGLSIFVKRASQPMAHAIVMHLTSYERSDGIACRKHCMKSSLHALPMRLTRHTALAAMMELCQAHQSGKCTPVCITASFASKLLASARSWMQAGLAGIQPPAKSNCTVSAISLRNRRCRAVQALVCHSTP